MKRAATSGIVMRAMGLFGGLQAFTILCGVVRVKCVALLLGTVGVGLFSIFNSALMLLSTATQLSLRTSAVREIASRADRSSRRRIISAVRFWGWMLGAFGAFVAILTAPLFSHYTFGDLGNTILFALLAPALLLMSATSAAQAVMQATGRLRPLAASTLWGVAGGLLLTVPLLYFLGTASIVPVLLVYAAAGYVGVVIYRGTDEHPPVCSTLRDRWHEGAPMLRLGGYMTVAAVLTELTNYIFIAFLTRAGGEDTVGVYQSGYTIIMRYVGMVFTSLAVEYYPRLAANDRSPRRQQVFVAHELAFIMAVLAPVLVLFIPLSPLVLRLLYSSEFTAAVPYMVLAAPGLVLKGYSWCLSYMMLAKGDGRVYMSVETASAIIGLALNIAGYYIGGIAGLGFAFTAWYAVYSLMVTWIYIRRYRCRIPARPLLISATAFTVVSLIAYIAYI